MNAHDTRPTLPETSILAWEQEIESGRFKTNLQKVQRAIERFPGMTAGEYSALFKKTQRTWAARYISYLKTRLGTVRPACGNDGKPFMRHCTAFPTTARCEVFEINDNPEPVSREYVKILKSEYEHLLAIKRQQPYLKASIRREKERADGQEVMGFLKPGDNHHAHPRH